MSASSFPAGWVETEPVALARVAPVPWFVGHPGLATHHLASDEAAFVPERLARLASPAPTEELTARRDDNRTALFLDRRAEIDGIEYRLAVKGCGASVDAFEHRPLDLARLKEICRDELTRTSLGEEPLASPGFLTGERWYGNAPYGGQAGDNALGGLLVSLRAAGSEIAGFRICPVASVVELPEAVAAVARRFYWYRRYSQGYFQEQRWMPSNVRLYFHSPVTLGLQPNQVFHLFELRQRAECDRFLENLARSLAAAITLFARTLRADPAGDGYRGLDFQDVWLDKDAVIAPNGLLHFADLEGIEEGRVPDIAAARQTIESQFYRNLYEAAYALEAVAAEGQRRFGETERLSDRRRWIEEALVRGLKRDAFVRGEMRRDGLVWIVRSALESPALELELPWSTAEAN